MEIGLQQVSKRPAPARDPKFRFRFTAMPWLGRSFRREAEFALLMRVIAAIIFGVLAFAWPSITLLTLMLFYGAFALVDGVLAVIAAITGGAPAPRWWLVIVCLLGIAAGLLTFLMPALSALVLLFFIAGWAIATGVFQIIGAIQLRKEIDNEWLLILGGIISVLFGIGVMFGSGCGALALVWVIGTYAVIVGGLLVALAFRLKEARTFVMTGSQVRNPVCGTIQDTEVTMNFLSSLTITKAILF